MAEFPRDWQVDTIGSLVEIETGSKNTQDKEDGGDYPFYVRSDTVERINCYTHDTEGVVTAGDGVGTGKVFHFVKGKFALHQRCYLMHQFKPVLDPQYFYWFFKTYFYDRITSMTAKSSVDSVRREMIAGMQIAYPDIPEQRRIADALDSVDKLIDNLSRRIEKKRQVKQGVMQALLTGKKRLPRFKEDWTEKALCSIASIEKGVQFDQRKLVEHAPYPLINGGTEPSGYSYEYNSDGEFITISEGGNSCGFVNQYNGRFWCGGHCYKVEVIESIDNAFLYYLLKFNESKIMALRVGSGLPNIQRDRLKAFVMRVPDDIEEQRTIAKILSDMDAEIEKLEAKRDKYVDIKQGMMNDLLTGKVRI